MAAKSPFAVRVVTLVAIVLASSCVRAAPVAGPSGDAANDAANPVTQEMLELPVRVVDPAGEPVAGAVIRPWALRSSQGHGFWIPERVGGFEVPRVTTNSDGHATVAYPKYTRLDERVLTLQVTLSIDHPDFPFVSHENVDIPRKETSDHVVTLQRGAKVEILPAQDGAQAVRDGLHVLWSDNRSWESAVKPALTDDGGLRLPTMAAGPGQLLVVRLEGERATHFSPITDIDPVAGDTLQKSVDLTPAARLTGELSANVPRPVKNGRLVAQVLSWDASRQNVEWFTWAPIAEDGKFVIESWPASEAVQLIALCDGFLAASGDAPPDVQNAGEPTTLLRPQVFSPATFARPLALRMTDMARCEVRVIDAEGAPIADVKVSGNPNVHWWNDGSQNYCSSLVRAERVLMTREYLVAIDSTTFPHRCEAITDAQGRAVLELSPVETRLYAKHEHFELPITRGDREEMITLVVGETAHVTLEMQPKGTEYLGDWDKLAGTLFGCTGEECRRLVADEGFRKQMEVVRAQLAAGNNPRDHKLLMQAYARIGDAFEEIHDQAEAVKWKQKAAEQAAKASAETASPK